MISLNASVRVWSGLVASLVNMWTKQPGPERTRLPEHVADACIRVLGMPTARRPDCAPAVISN